MKKVLCSSRLDSSATTCQIVHRNVVPRSHHLVSSRPAATPSSKQRSRAILQVRSMQSDRPGSSMGSPADAAPGGNSLVRRPNSPMPQQAIAVDMSQVVGKQVITRTTGRDLGIVSCMWVDPNRGEVVSMDLDDKKGVGSTRVANVHLSRLTQIGDVVLVHDEQVLYDQPLDGRFGFIILAGMEVRTRSGDFLGKVRDFSFSPDNGTLSKLAYDDFGLQFLPVTFFDTFSLAMPDVLSISPGAVIVADEAKYRERKETSGLFAAIPSLLKSIGSGRSAAPPVGLLGTSDPYRQTQQQDGYLPQGYSYQQWESDVRRWEQETGLSYDQYIRAQGGSRSSSKQLASGSAAAVSAAAAGGRSVVTRGAVPSQAGSPQQFGQQPQYGAPQQPQYGASSPGLQPPPRQQPQQPQQQSSWQPTQRAQQPAPQQQPQPQQGLYSRQPMQQQPQRQQADPRYRSPSSAPSPATSSPYGSPPTEQRPPQQQQQPGARGMPPSPSQQQQPGAAGQAAAPGRGSGRPELSGRRVDEWITPDDGRKREMVMEEAGPGGAQKKGGAAATGWGEIPAAGASGAGRGWDTQSAGGYPKRGASPDKPPGGSTDASAGPRT